MSTSQPAHAADEASEAVCGSTRPGPHPKSSTESTSSRRPARRAQRAGQIHRRLASADGEVARPRCADARAQAKRGYGSVASAIGPEPVGELPDAPGRPAGGERRGEIGVDHGG